MLRAQLVLGILSTVALAGCHNVKLATYPVNGTVVINGKPAANAMVIFCPIDGSDQLKRERPFATTSTDGSFQLTTFDKGDGAPAGQYKVLVQWTSASQSADRDRANASPDQLRGRYMNLETTPLTATVNSSATEIPPIELKSQ